MSLHKICKKLFIQCFAVVQQTSPAGDFVWSSRPTYLFLLGVWDYEAQIAESGVESLEYCFL